MNNTLCLCSEPYRALSFSSLISLTKESELLLVQICCLFWAHNRHFCLPCVPNIQALLLHKL